MVLLLTVMYLYRYESRFHIVQIARQDSIPHQVFPHVVVWGFACFDGLSDYAGSSEYASKSRISGVRLKRTPVLVS